ncbi:MAG: hypothetical protein OEO23_06985 [Gemmatimonadota bacterium]|nr:hypothetical protein [Gemmatimonadota bacterium]
MHTSPLSLLIAPAARANNHLVDVVLADLPTDPASVTVLLLLLGAVGAVVWFGRSKGPPPA